MAESKEIQMLTTEQQVIVKATQAPAMTAGSHDVLMEMGYEVSWDGEDEIEYNGDGAWVLVHKQSRQILDFG